MNIEITQLTESVAVDITAIRGYTRRVMEWVADLAPDFHWTELSLVLTDDAIRALNREWFGKNQVTDVISFAYPDSGDGAGDTGEVIVNLRQAMEEGRLRNGPDEELALYIAHGCHHLTGAEDNTPERKRAMLTRETRWVRQARNENLAGPFFFP